MCEEPLTSEKEYYDRSAVEEKVKQLLRSLIGLDHTQDLVNKCKEVEFRKSVNGCLPQSILLSMAIRRTKTAAGPDRE